jgi:hypothetical protein
MHFNIVAKEAVMKEMRISIYSLALLLATSPSAFASSTTRVYNSGILVLAFLGFCALVVVIQLIPAIITLCGMLKSLTHKADTRKANVRIG